MFTRPTPALPQRASRVSAAMSGIYQRSPQPGEIWQLNPQPSLLPSIGSAFQSPEAASTEAAMSQSGRARYIMVVQEPQPLDSSGQSDWQIVSAMLLSDGCQNSSAVDILIASEVTGLNQVLLAQTWHLLSVLTCNLAGSVGQRLPRQVYDLLLTVGDCYYTAQQTPPAKAELHAAGLFPGRGDAHSPVLAKEIRAFHKRERHWSSFFNRQIAACRVAAKQQQVAQTLLYEALQVEQALVDRPSSSARSGNQNL